MPRAKRLLQTVLGRWQRSHRTTASALKTASRDDVAMDWLNLKRSSKRCPRIASGLFQLRPSTGPRPNCLDCICLSDQALIEDAQGVPVRLKMRHLGKRKQCFPTERRSKCPPMTAYTKSGRLQLKACAADLRSSLLPRSLGNAASWEEARRNPLHLDWCQALQLQRQHRQRRC